MATGRLNGARGRHRAAVRLHHVERSGEPVLAQRRIDRREIAADVGSDIAVENRGRGPLVLAILAQDFVRQRDERIGQQLAQQLADRDLVRRIGIGVQQTDRYRFHLGDAQLGDRGTHR